MHLARRGRRAAAGAAQTVITIGIINSFPGFLGPLGDEMQKDMQLYAKTHREDLPPNIGTDLIARDKTSSPEIGKRLAQELIAHQKVNILLGVIGSLNRDCDADGSGEDTADPFQC